MPVGRPFQPGQSGNPNGRPKTRPFKDALKKALEAAGDDSEGLRLVAVALVQKAREGDVSAIKELADRIDGKVAQAIIGGDDDDPAVQHIHRIERVIVRPPNPDG
jgi:hypothetical protein